MKIKFILPTLLLFSINIVWGQTKPYALIWFTSETLPDSHIGFGEGVIKSESIDIDYVFYRWNSRTAGFSITFFDQTNGLKMSIPSYIFDEDQYIIDLDKNFPKTADEAYRLMDDLLDNYGSIFFIDRNDNEDSSYPKVIVPAEFMWSTREGIF